MGTMGFYFVLNHQGFYAMESPPRGALPTYNTFMSTLSSVCGGGGVLYGGKEVFSGHSMIGIEGGARSPSNDFILFSLAIYNHSTFSISTHVC
jgi:hypothetical protein